MDKHIILIRARSPQEIEARSPVLVIGIVSKRDDGWHFTPMASGRKFSRVGKATFEKAIPRWTGGLDATESFHVEPGETFAQAISRFRGTV